MAGLASGLETAIEAYLASHPRDPDHPFLARRPAAWRLRGWATLLESGGHQASHIHPTAWLSGVYDVELPPEVGSGEDRQGWIEFGRPGSDFPGTAEPLIRQMRPEAGKVILFPSYFTHNTLPFESDRRRLSLPSTSFPPLGRRRRHDRPGALDTHPADRRRLPRARLPGSPGRWPAVAPLSGLQGQFVALVFWPGATDPAGLAARWAPQIEDLRARGAASLLISRDLTAWNAAPIPGLTLAADPAAAGAVGPGLKVPKRGSILP